MKILIAEDDVISCKGSEKHTKERSYGGATPSEENEIQGVTESDSLRLAIFDWIMFLVDRIEKKYV